ncbi:MAG: RNA-binding protein hfq [Chloroflexaceae bacterium]|nr:RNA-binding protein hfq [Chloroflexaceae bacterium]
MSEFNPGLPSARLLQEFIKNKQEIELKLLTDDLLLGKLLWQDDDCVCLVGQYEQQTLVWRQAIAYLKPKA